MKFVTDTGEATEAYIDGYAFGDRLLEGVMFRLNIVDGAVKCTGVHQDCDKYMKQFSKNKITDWMKTAESESYQDCYTDLSGRVDIWVEDIE